MPQDAYVVERLVISIQEQTREEVGTDMDRLSLQVSWKNPLGSPGSTRRPPAMEVRDSAERIYEPANEDWAEPLLPDTETSSVIQFDIARDAVDLVLVFAPGEPEELQVQLD